MYHTTIKVQRYFRCRHSARFHRAITWRHREDERIFVLHEPKIFAAKKFFQLLNTQLLCGVLFVLTVAFHNFSVFKQASPGVINLRLRLCCFFFFHRCSLCAVRCAAPVFYLWLIHKTLEPARWCNIRCNNQLPNITQGFLFSRRVHIRVVYSSVSDF